MNALPEGWEDLDPALADEVAAKLLSSVFTVARRDAKKDRHAQLWIESMQRHLADSALARQKRRAA
jgi:hypothetical protein